LDKNTQDAVNAFKGLSDDDIKALGGINDRIQANIGELSLLHQDERTASSALVFPWAEQISLIHEFVQFMYDKKLIIIFAWTEWQEGRDWYALQDDSKYDKLDVETALKLLTAVIRNDRFNNGALVDAFESDVFPKILQKLITI